MMCFVGRFSLTDNKDPNSAKLLKWNKTPLPVKETRPTVEWHGGFVGRFSLTDIKDPNPAKILPDKDSRPLETQRAQVISYNFS
jgi:hypothetical protein